MAVNTRLERFKSAFSSNITGNILDHYDTALYGFLAPVIAPVVFQDHDPVSQLILAYGLMSLGFITRPFGSWFFGRYINKHGPSLAFALTLFGLGATTAGMACIPSYSVCGQASPILLTVLRLLQGFFAAGETMIAPLLILEHTPTKKFSLVSGIYQSSSVLGILLASLAASLVLALPDTPHLWRLPFVLGSCSAWIAWLVRKQLIDDRPFVKQQTGMGKLIRNNKLLFAQIIAASSVSYITYSVPFVFLNGFMPLISSITFTEMLMLNTSLLTFDMVFIPVLGLLADRFEPRSFMSLVALVLGISMLPAFLSLPNATLLHVTAVRVWIVVLGLAFLAPLHGWFFRQISGPEKYGFIGLGYAIGSEVFGRSLPAVCLFLWRLNRSPGAPGIYLAGICFVSCALLLANNKRLE